ncbi:MAG TPA: outer membrane lipoprotein-sorting protein [Proteobacteria bacterium]|nr:hypothetical protein BMS3Abin14_02083 [bacterium BMS3Abin14]HDL53949.1 outer membrane lipoprotein-sorting protein [Pseudomonadota bacterium]
MKKTLIAAVLTVLFMVPATYSFALSVDQIVEKANIASYYGGDNGMAKVHMVITDRRGRTREREFTILRKDVKDGGDQLYYVYFHKPGDVRKLVFMVHKHVGKNDDRWLYLPALDLVKRIAASDKRTSFVGSNFLYEDVSGRSTKADTHTLKEETGDHWILDNIPRDPASVEFTHYLIWIDKKTYLVDKAEYYNAQGKVYRKMVAEEVKVIDGIPTVVKSRVEDLNSGGKTELTFSNIKYNIGIKDSIFTERYLRKPPRKFIRR